MGEVVWWTYGVVPPGSSAPERGIEGYPVEVVERDGLAALASPVPAAEFSGAALQRTLEDLEALGRLANGHDAVLERAMSEADVVPFRMCTLYKTRAAIEEMLVAERPRLAQALERVHDAFELGVKAFAPPRRRDEAQHASSGRDYLARRMAQRDREAASDETLERSIAEVHAQLTDRASAAVLLRPQQRQLSGRDEEMILNGAYLVPRRDVSDFTRLVETIAPDDLALEVTGPWPPYHFAEGDE